MTDLKTKQLDQSGASGGQVLTFNSSTGKWEPGTFGALGIGAPSGGFALHDTTHSPAALWQFDNDFTDSSGNGLNLTESDDPEFGVLAGSGRRYWQNIDSRAVVTADALQITGALTVECVLRDMLTPALGNTPIFITTAGISETEAENALYICDLKRAQAGFGMSWEFGAGANEIAEVGGAWLSGEWFHYAFTRASDGLTIKWYVNGVEVHSDVASNAPTGGVDSQTTVGGHGFVGNLYFTGGMQSLKVIASELSAAQVLAEAQLTGFAA